MIFSSISLSIQSVNNVLLNKTHATMSDNVVLSFTFLQTPVLQNVTVHVAGCTRSTCPVSPVICNSDYTACSYTFAVPSIRGSLFGNFNFLISILDCAGNFNSANATTDGSFVIVGLFSCFHNSI